LRSADLTEAAMRASATNCASNLEQASSKFQKRAATLPTAPTTKKYFDEKSLTFELSGLPQIDAEGRE